MRYKQRRSAQVEQLRSTNTCVTEATGGRSSPKRKALTMQHKQHERNRCPNLETTTQQREAGVHHPHLGVAQDLRHPLRATCGKPSIG